MVAETHAAAAVSAIQLHDGAFPGSSVNSVTTSFVSVNYESFFKFKVIPNEAIFFGKKCHSFMIASSIV